MLHWLDVKIRHQSSTLINGCQIIVPFYYIAIMADLNNASKPITLMCYEMLYSLLQKKQN